MARRTEEPSRNSATLSDITGMTSEEVEKKLATKLGIQCPLAGLPDEKAIRKVFGFTRNDLYPDKTRRLYKGSRRKGKRPRRDDEGWEEFGDHDMSGADSS